MRSLLLLVPFALSAAPAAAQQAPSPVEGVEIPAELTDPAMMDRLGAMMEAMSKVFLELPVGEVEAAAEGRQPTEADRRRTVRSESGMSESELKAHIADAKPAMQAGMKALAAALPAMMRGMAEAGKELEKAATNMPQPGYPKQ